MVTFIVDAFATARKIHKQSKKKTGTNKNGIYNSIFSRKDNGIHNDNYPKAI